MLERERVRTLHDKIDVILEQMIRNYAAAGVDCVFFSEDWGAQSQLLISPKLWYEEFFGRFQKPCSVAHRCGIKVFMHSCGQIGAIIPGLMKAGVDVLQLDQPDLHGIETLASLDTSSRAESLSGALWASRGHCRRGMKKSSAPRPERCSTSCGRAKGVLLRDTT